MALPEGYYEAGAYTLVDVQLSTVLWIFGAVGALLAFAAYWAYGRPERQPAVA